MAYKGYKDSHDPQQVEINIHKASKDIRAYTDSIEEDEDDISILQGYREDLDEYIIQVWTEEPYYKIAADPYYKELQTSINNFATTKLKENNLRWVKMNVIVFDNDYNIVYGEDVPPK